MLQSQATRQGKIMRAYPAPLAPFSYEPRRMSLPLILRNLGWLWDSVFLNGIYSIFYVMKIGLVHADMKGDKSFNLRVEKVIESEDQNRIAVGAEHHILLG
jgi:hypothetical protein